MKNGWITEKTLLYVVGIVLALVVICGGVFGWQVWNWQGKAESTLDGMTAEIGRLDDGLADATSNLGVLTEKANSLDASIVSIQKDYGGQLSNLRTDLAGLESKLNAIVIDSDTISSNKVQLVQLKAQLVQVRKDITSLSNRIANLGGYYWDDDIIARYNSQDGFVVGSWSGRITSDAWVGQTFKTGGAESELRRVGIYSKRVGSPTTVSLKLYNVGSGIPTGGVLQEVTVDASSWSTTGGWGYFEFTGYLLFPNMVYAVVIVDADGDNANYVAIGQANDGYTGGTWVQTLNGGGNWTAHGVEAGFEIWGVRR